MSKTIRLDISDIIEMHYSDEEKKELLREIFFLFLSEKEQNNEIKYILKELRKTEQELENRLGLVEAFSNLIKML